MPTTLLLLPSSGIKGGNYYTMERIQSHLEECGHTCHLWNVQELKEKGDVNKVLKDNQVDLVIGIHAFRTGEVLKDCEVPYILILGGTDVNEFHKDPAKMDVMTSAVTCASRVIAFSDSLRKNAVVLWSSLIASKLVVITQAVKTNPSNFDLLRYLNGNHGITNSGDRRIFLLVGAVRPVEDPIYLMDTFSQLHKRDPKILFVIIGPVSDTDYNKDEFEPALKRYPGVVVHIPGLPGGETHAAIQQSFALVNSSASEGMSPAIPKAMQLNIPVLARKIEGNSAVIQDDQNGLLFSNPEEFHEKALRLLYCNDCKDRLVVKAAQDVANLYNVETEKKAYPDIVQENSADTSPRTGETENTTEADVVQQNSTDTSPKTAVKTNPCDRDDFNLIRRLEEEHGIKDIDDRQIFLLVGAVRPVKDPIYLMDTFSQLQEENPKILFVIIGPVSDEHYHKHKFQPALQRYRRVVVHIPGLPQEDTHAAIQQSFALVNSSESEGMSLAILEAMQLKTPVLARNIEGNSAVIEDDKNGLLFSEPKEFLEKALRLLYCNKCKDRLVVNAEQDVAKLYNVETEKKAYLEIVQQNSTDTRTSTDNRSCRRFNLCMLLVLCAPILFIIVKKNY